MRRRTLALAAAVALLAAAVYWPARAYDYIAVDDQLYASENAFVRSGLTLAGVGWAFTSVGHAGNWHPLTWISLMLDVQLLGPGPGGHHLVNLLLHAAASALALVAFAALTGAPAASAAAAALFAVHPLHVESVAWVSERKDVLSACLFLLTILAHVSHRRRPARWRRAAVALTFALGLLAKPMLVTLPFVLALLDWWPLGGGTPLRTAAPRLLREQAPLLALAAASCALTLLAQGRGGLIAPLAAVSPGYRAANALTSYAAYLGKAVWPATLAFWYPHPGSALPLVKAVAAGALVAAVSAACAAAHRRPWLAAGWLWYLGTLVPVIGFVQVGAQAMADRYTYLPLLGPFLALAWEGAAAARRGWPARAAAAATLALLACLALIARRQLALWRDSESLFSGAVAVTSDNWVMHDHLGKLFLAEGRNAEAEAHLREALRIKPRYQGIRNGVAIALAAQGRLEEAAREYEQMLRQDPHAATPLFDLGNLAERQGRLDRAAALFREAVRRDPRYDAAHNNLAAVLLRQGEEAEALEHLRQAVGANPRNAEAQNNLGAVLLGRGLADEALRHYREALAARPGYVTAMLGLARTHLALGQRDQARRWFEETLRRDPRSAEAADGLRRLAAAPDRPAP